MVGNQQGSPKRRARVQTHYTRVLTGALAKAGGADKCGVSKDILLEQEPEFMRKIATTSDIQQ